MARYWLESEIIWSWWLTTKPFIVGKKMRLSFFCYDITLYEKQKSWNRLHALIKIPVLKACKGDNQNSDSTLKKTLNQERILMILIRTNGISHTLKPTPNLPMWSGSYSSCCLWPRESILIISLWDMPCPSSVIDSTGTCFPDCFKYRNSMQMSNLQRRYIKVNT